MTRVRPSSVMRCASTGSTLRAAKLSPVSRLKKKRPRLMQPRIKRSLPRPLRVERPLRTKPPSTSLRQISRPKMNLTIFSGKSGKRFPRTRSSSDSARIRSRSLRSDSLGMQWPPLQRSLYSQLTFNRSSFKMARCEPSRAQFAITTGWEPGFTWIKSSQRRRRTPASLQARRPLLPRVSPPPQSMMRSLSMPRLGLTWCP